MKTQKRAIRIITGSPWNAHTDPLFAMLHIMKICEIHKMQVAFFMFEVHRNQLPAYFLDMFNTNSAIHSYNTRRANDYHIMYQRTSLLRTSIRFAGPLLWNSIAHDIKITTSLNTFKFIIKHSMFNMSSVGL